MNILITGAAGFIGTNICIKLQEFTNYNITAVDSDCNRCSNLKKLCPNIRIINSDMTDINILNNLELGYYDIVLHQAAVPRVLYSVEHPTETTNENVLKTIRLLESSAKGKIKRFIMASSGSVYGNCLNACKEEDKLSPESPYALQKKNCEEYCKLFSKLYNLDTVCLRYANIFGSYQEGNSPYSTVISAWCNAIKNGLPLRKEGTGEQTRDMTHVSNVVYANSLCITHPERFNGEIFNVATGEIVSLNQIFDYLSDNYEIEWQNFPARAGDVMNSSLDISKIKSSLGYIPLTGFWEGLKKTTEWYGL